MLVHGRPGCAGLPDTDTWICFGCSAVKVVADPEPITDDETLRLTPGQELAIDAMVNGSEHMFLTGEAGTGKSFALLRALEQIPPRRVACVAPTGIVAVTLPAGATIHSFCQIRDLNTLRVHALDAAKREAYRDLKILVIDEISMVRADLMDKLDEFLRMNGPAPGKPFGGLRLVMVGDLYQLPPIVKRQDAIRFSRRGEYETPFFFSANCWKDASFVTINLTDRVRFTDASWGRTLEDVRVGSITDAGLRHLNNVGLGCMPDEEDMRLFTTKAPAKAFNEEKLDDIDAQLVRYRGSVDGSVKKHELEALLVYPEIALKEGARVMTIRNDTDGSFQNGTLGEVIGLEKNYVTMRTDKGRVVRVPPASWEYYSYDLSLEPAKKGDDNTYPKYDEKHGRMIVGKYTQIPIALAWASTVHKAQGLTLDGCHLSLGSGAFAAGQTYVGLSRLRALDGLSLARGIRRGDILFSGPEALRVCQYVKPSGIPVPPCEAKIELFQFIKNYGEWCHEPSTRALYNAYTTMWLHSFEMMITAHNRRN
jgi:ATP-dependent DNA helicase PIF1